MNAKGKGIPRQISEIENIPFDQFSELQHAVETGEARILRFAYDMDSDLFSTLASKSESAKSTFGLTLAYGGPLAVISGAFVF